ncbi:MAG TPA: BTAD domain-containing putative transcriptional regulator [Acidimicrobiales bacterium]|nr:BTAD domain-containing putative transcriptional regulator [Acidimicrobiales bacterium]
MAENRLARRGNDVWIGVEPGDGHSDRLASAVAVALVRNAAVAAGTARASAADTGGAGPDDPAATNAGLSLPTEPAGGTVDPGTVADAVWHRAPAEVCLVFDDVHLLPVDSPGATWLAALVDALPANGHVLLASRSEPPIPLARLAAQATVLRVDETALRFTDAELTAFAERRGIDPDRLGDRSGWPAVAELSASAGHQLAGTFLWEEVLEPLGEDRRRVLGVLCELGGADDRLASAAIGAPAELASSLHGIPLVARSADGWHVPHALWSEAPGVALSPGEAGAVRDRAVDHLSERERFDDAFALIREAELWDKAPSVLRQACLGAQRRTTAELDLWLSSCPDTVRSSVGGRLATGLLAAFATPGEAAEPLRQTVAYCREDGDLDAELVAIAQLTRLAWWSQDLRGLGAELGRRVFELEATGHPQARALASFGRAIVADLMGDDTTMLEQLDGIERGVLDPSFEVAADWLRGVVLLDLGDATGARAAVERIRGLAVAMPGLVVDSLYVRARWALGQVDAVLAEIPERIALIRAGGVTANRFLNLAISSVMLSYTGDVEGAQRCYDEAAPLGPPGAGGVLPARTALVLASLQLARGDEAEATASLVEAIDTQGLDQGVDRRAWRLTLPLTYVLVPSTRGYWDGRPLEGHLRLARDLARAVAAVRTGGDDERLRALPLPDLNLVRSVLHHRLAAELAVGLTAQGRPEGAALLEALGPPGRDAVRALAGARSRRTKLARSLLASVPHPPARSTYVGVLGRLEVRRDGPEGDLVDDANLRRKRLRALLAFLIGHRTTDRAAVAAALWPDNDERSAANNLAVTLSYLLHLLEPDRPTGEPAFAVRLDGQGIRLVTGDHLRLDTDAFDAQLAEAADAEANGAPSLALDHHLAAVALYRGDLHSELPDAEWAVIDREHYRTRFLASAIRAGQLLVARGDTAEAEMVARRALDVDPFSEAGHAVLVAAALAVGDRSAARRWLEACFAALAELDLEPSDATLQLRRRMRVGASAAAG